MSSSGKKVTKYLQLTTVLGRYGRQPDEYKKLQKSNQCDLINHGPWFKMFFVYNLCFL